MKIVFFNMNLERGGAEKHLISLLNAWPVATDQLELVLLEDRGDWLRDLPAHVKLVKLGGRRPSANILKLIWGVCMAWRLARYLKRSKPKLLLTFVWPLACLAGFAKLFSFQRYYLIWNAQSDLVRNLKSTAFYRLKLFLIRTLLHRSLNLVLAPSVGLAQSLAETLKLTKDQVNVVPNAVEIDHKQKIQPARHLSSALKIVSVGRLHKAKGFDLLIEALAVLASSGANFICQIVGAGSEQSSLQELIQKNKLDARIELIGASDQIGNFLLDADIFVSSSHWETFGIAIAEALLVGLPVVATRTDGAQELVVHNQNGLLVELGDKQGLAQALASLVSSPELRRKLASSQRESLRDKLKPSSIAKSYSEIFIELAQKKRLAFFINITDFFISHRLILAEAAKAHGFSVHIIGPADPSAEWLQKKGYDYHVIPLKKWGSNPFWELYTLLSVFKVISRIRPDILHNVTIKPVLYGSIIARICGLPKVINAISGLGFVYLSKNLSSQLRRSIIEKAYSILFKDPRVFLIFQNPDDQQLFLERGLVEKNRCHLMPGSGVDLHRFIPKSPEKNGAEPTILFPARLLWKKGLREFVEAAQIVKGKGLRGRFLVAGDTVVGNPDSVPVEVIEAWKSSNLVEFLGFCPDMAKLYSQVDLVCLPSYREGLPKALIEAAACGKPLISTDTAGCREIVRDGVNGILVPVQDSEALARAIEKLLIAPDLRVQYAKKSRQIAEEEFSDQLVVKQTLALYSS